MEPVGSSRMPARRRSCSTAPRRSATSRPWCRASASTGRTSRGPRSTSGRRPGLTAAGGRVPGLGAARHRRARRRPRPSSGSRHVYGASLVYTELIYSEDRESDERHVWLTDVARRPHRRRLDASGLRDHARLNQYGIVWKEADPGFHMLNWGTMLPRTTADGGTILPETAPQEYVELPVGRRALRDVVGRRLHAARACTTSTRDDAR